MNFKKIALYAVVFSILGLGTTAVYGQSSTSVPNEVVTPLHYAVTMLTFVAAGMFYSSSGYAKKLRKKLSGDTSVTLDYKKMGKTTIIGIIIGVAAFIWSTYHGETITVTTMEQFFVQVGLNMTAVLIIDKWLLGRSETPNSMS